MSASPVTTYASPASASAARSAAVVFGAALGLGGGWSAAYFGTLPVFMKPIAETFVWSRAEASLVLSLSQLGIAGGAPIAGLLIDRCGARHVIAGSALLFALGVFLLPTFPNRYAFAALTLLIGLVAVGTVPVGYLSVVPRVFSRRLGLALGLSMVGPGIGAMLFPIAAQGWITAYGWQNAYRLIAAVILLVGMFAVAILSWGAGPAASIVGVRKQDQLGLAAGDTLQAALRSWRFWLIAAVFFTTATFFLGAAIHLSALLTDSGVAPDIAAGTVALIGVGVVAGRLATGAMLDRFPARAMTAIAFLLGAAGLWTLLPDSGASLPVILVGAVSLGLAVGAEGDLMPFIVRRYFGLKNLGVLYGIVFCTYALGAVAGPVLYAVAFEQFGSYSVMLESGIVACLCCAPMVLLVGSYRFGAGAPEPQRSV